MPDKTTKKTVSKASAGKQVKPAANASPPTTVAAAATPDVATQGTKPSDKSATTASGSPGAAAPAPVATTAGPAAAASASAAPPAAPVESPAKPVSAAADGSGSSTETPSWEDVARKAYELFESDGAPHGRDQDHWFRAEQALRKRP